MALKPGDVENFKTILRAAKHEDLALLECQDRQTGEYVACVCAVFVDEAGLYNMVPLARLFAGDPYDDVRPCEPASRGGDSVRDSLQEES